MFIFLTGLVIVALVSLFKYTNAKPEYFYAKVMVKKTSKDNPYPGANYTKLLKKGDVIKDFVGNKEVEILAVRYYPRSSDGEDNTNAYTIFLYLKIKKDDSKSKRFFYNKKEVKPGKNLDLDFFNAAITAEPLIISTEPIQEKYVEKTVTLWRYEGQSASNPNTFENIKVGESYFDGEDKVFEILSKRLVDLEPTGSNFQYIFLNSSLKHVEIKVRMKLLDDNGIYYFADQPIRYRMGLNIFSDHNFFDLYTVVGIANE